MNMNMRSSYFKEKHLSKGETPKLSLKREMLSSFNLGKNINSGI